MCVPCEMIIDSMVVLLLNRHIEPDFGAMHSKMVIVDKNMHADERIISPAFLLESVVHDRS